MASLSQLKGKIPRHVLIQGLPKVGKTTLAATLAAKYELDWLDIETGAETLLKLPQEYQDRINYARIPDSGTYPIAAETVMKLFKSKRAHICYNHGKVDCTLCAKDTNATFADIDFSAGYPMNRILVIDTATQLGLSCLANVMRTKPVDVKPERDDWGALRKFTEFLSSEFQAFPGNIIVLVHSIETELEDGKKKLVPNFGSASMSAMFAKAFSHVIYVTVENKIHKAFSSSTYSNNVLTGSRTDYKIEDQKVLSLLPLFESLDMSAISAPAAGAIVIPITSEETKTGAAPAANAMAALTARYTAAAKKP